MKKHLLALLALVAFIGASAQNVSETVGWTEEDEIEVSDINHSGMFVNIGGGLGFNEHAGYGVAGDIGYRYHIKNGWYVEAALTFFSTLIGETYYSNKYIPITAGFRYNTGEIYGNKTAYVGLRIGYGITVGGRHNSGFAFNFSPGINLSRYISLGIFIDGVCHSDISIVAGPRLGINF